MYKLKQWVKSSLHFQFFVVLVGDGDMCVCLCAYTNVSTLAYVNMGAEDVQVPWSISGG